MAVRALAIAKTVPHRPVSASQTLFHVTGCTLELFVRSLERIVRELHMVEPLDLEPLGDVTGITLARG